MSPFARLLGIGLIAAGLLGWGYYQGYSREHEKFLQYKADIAAQVKQQDLLLQSRVKQEQIKTEGIINEYKAKLHTVRTTSGRLQYNTGTLQLPQTTGTEGTIAAPSYSVLVGQCLETTLMLTSLQEWAKFISHE
jgi:hypothetical protein